MRERWLGATGVKVPEIAVEGTDVTVLADGRISVGGDVYPALIAGRQLDADALRAAHGAGMPVLARASTAEEVKRALAHPEVACVLVPAERAELRDVDLTALTYG